MNWSCKISQKAILPQIALPESFQANNSGDTVSIGSLPWKVFIQDQTLRNLIDTAIGGNNDLQIALKNISSAEQVLRQSRSANIPTLTAKVLANTAYPSDNSLNGLTLKNFLGTSHIEDYTVNLTASWEVDIWGKIKNRKSIALSTLLQTHEARKAIQTRIVVELARSYYNLVMLDDQIVKVHKSLALNDSLIQITRIQFKVGQTTSLAVDQVEAQRLASERLLPILQNEIHLNETAISILCGQLPHKIERTALIEIPRSSNLSTGVPSRILKLRPDVQISQLEFERANTAAGLAEADMYPSLIITAQGGINTFKASNWFSIPASLFGMVGGGLTQPILNNRSLKTNYKLALLAREKSVISFRERVLVAVGEVSNALESISSLTSQEYISQQRQVKLNSAVLGAKTLFTTGTATYLEIITAQGNMLQNELELSQVKKAQLDAELELYRVLGGGWQ